MVIILRVIDLKHHERKVQKKTTRKANREETQHPEFVFFHIGKTGGGSVRTFLLPVRDRWAGAGHQENLSSISQKWPGVPMTFFVRDPITWFVSAFNNFRRAVVQKPEGKLPSQIDLTTYHLFPTPNDLAEGLASTDERILSAARWAMSSHGFLKRPLATNLGGGPEVVDRHLSTIPLICVFEEFDRSIEAMRVVFNLPSHLKVPKEDDTVHKGLSHLPKKLSDVGRRAVAEWYRDDIAVYEHCRTIHEHQTKELLGG